MSSYETLAERFESLVADIDELAFDELRMAAADGATTRPASDRELQKARRAAEKGAAILRRLADPS